MAKIPLIIDCDPGHDDAIALMLAASASDVFDLRAVTTVGGAQSVDKTFYNARRVLTVIGLDVPVARGAAQPMVRDRSIYHWVFLCPFLGVDRRKIT